MNVKVCPDCLKLVSGAHVCVHFRPIFSERMEAAKKEETPQERKYKAIVGAINQTTFDTRGTIESMEKLINALIHLVGISLCELPEEDIEIIVNGMKGRIF